MTTFRDTFDPVEWSAIYDSKKPEPSHFAFRHGVEVALKACTEISNPQEIWIDVGSGTGDLAAMLARERLQVTGIDHDPWMIEAASKRFADPKALGAVKFIQSTADHLPFAAGTVHGIVATSVMGCLSSPDSFYAEAFRVLKPGGKLVLTFTNRSSFLLRLNARLHKSDGDSYHIYSVPEIVADLQKSGFQTLKIRFYNFFLNPWNVLLPPRPLALLLERSGRFPWTRYLGRNFLVVASKGLAIQNR